MIIRANQLRPGDVFVKLQTFYKVWRVEESIKAMPATQTGKGRRHNYSMEIGLNSIERVELISRLVVRKKPYRGSRYSKQRLSMAEFSIV